MTAAEKTNNAIKDIKTKAKRLWDENPVICIVLGIAAANASAKVINARAENRRSKVWVREVNRREKADRKK